MGEGYSLVTEAAQGGHHHVGFIPSTTGWLAMASYLQRIVLAIAVVATYIWISPKIRTKDIGLNASIVHKRLAYSRGEDVARDRR